MNKVNRILFSIIIISGFLIAEFAQAENNPNVKIALSILIQKGRRQFSGNVKVKTAIVDENGITKWSNDSSSTGGSSPSGFFIRRVDRGNLVVTLGGTGMDALPAAAIDGNGDLSLIVWVDAGFGFQKLKGIPLNTAPRAANALRVGGFGPDELLTVHSTLEIGNSNIIEPIASSKIAAFSSNNNNFTLGDGAGGFNKSILANNGTSSNPALRFNTATNQWQFSNDGSTYSNFGAPASGSIGTSELTDGAVTSAKILNGTIQSADIGTDVITAGNLAADSVSGSELTASGVVAGTYNISTITVDEDGRITSASNGSTAGDISSVGDATSGDAFVDGLSNGSKFIYEGSTVDTNETTLQFTGDPGSDSIVTIPNRTGTLITSGDTNSVNSTMISDGSVDVLDLAANSVDSSKINNDSIINADINSAAAISFSKLASLSSGNILVGNAGNVATSASLSGDATLSSAGALTIADNSVDGTDISLGGDSQGDVMYYNGTDWVRLAAGTSGQYLRTQGTGANPAWGTVNAITNPTIAGGKRSASFVPISNTAIVLTAVGSTNPTASVATSQPALLGATRNYLQWATTAVLANSAGITGPFTTTREVYRPIYSAIVRTDITITSTRIHVGLAESTLALLPTNTTAPTASAVDFASIAYDTGGTGNITDWLCCTGDGGNYSCTTTGVTVAPSVEYLMKLDWSVANQVTCSVNGTSVTKATNVSSAAVNLGMVSQITTLIAAIRNHLASYYLLEQN